MSNVRWFTDANEWSAKNTKPPATGKERDEFETQTTACYVTDV